MCHLCKTVASRRLRKICVSRFYSCGLFDLTHKNILLYILRWYNHFNQLNVSRNQTTHTHTYTKGNMMLLNFWNGTIDKSLNICLLTDFVLLYQPLKTQTFVFGCKQEPANFRNYNIGSTMSWALSSHVNLSIRILWLINMTISHVLYVNTDYAKNEWEREREREEENLRKKCDESCATILFDFTYTT